MMTVDSIRARVRRLHELYCELAKETHIPKREKADPLLFLERQVYRQAMHLAMGGIEDARVTLATTIQRLEESGPRTGHRSESNRRSAGTRDGSAAS